MHGARGFFIPSLFKSDEILEWGDSEHERISRILAYVTDNTNIPKFRKRIRPEGVRMLEIRQEMELMQNLNKEKLLDKYNILYKDYEKLFYSFEESERNNEYLAREKEYLSKEKFSLSGRIDHLENALRSSEDYRDNDRADLLLGILRSGNPPSPIQCLEIIESCYADKCEILESAKLSAKKYTNFSRGFILLDNLIKLVDEYRTCLLSGKGDAEAKSCFPTDVFASDESETVKNNSKLRGMRTFIYQDDQVEMFRHLKIGVSHDSKLIIRVYFHWDNERKKIILGHCGKHLPISSR